MKEQLVKTFELLERLAFPPPKAHREAVLAHVLRVLPLICVLTLVTYFVHHGKLLANFESPALDSFVRSAPIKLERTLLIDIQQPEYAEMFGGRRPLDATKLGEAVGAICSGEPSLLIVDLDTEDVTYRALRAAKFPCKVIWARGAVEHESEVFAAADGHANAEGGHGEVIEHPFEPEPVLGENNGNGVEYGFAVTKPDSRGYVRSYPTFLPILSQPESSTGVRKISMEETLPWKAINSLKKHQADDAHTEGVHGESEVKSPGNSTSHSKEPSTIAFKFSAFPQDYHGYSLRMALNQARENPSEWRKTLAGKIVLLGATFPASGDVHMTPLGGINGVKLVGFAIESYLQNDYLKELPAAAMIALDILIGVLCVVIAHFLPHRLVLFVIPILFPLIVFVLSFYCFDRLSVWVSFVPMLFGIYLHFLHDHFVEDREMMHELAELRERVGTHSTEHEH